MPFDILAQLVCFLFASFGKGGITVSGSEIGKFNENVIQEKCQPDAFAPAMETDEIHPIVPVTCTHQRKSMFPKPQPMHDCANAMVVQAGHLPGMSRQIIVRLLV